MEACCHANGFTLKLRMLRGLVGEELEDLADLGVVIWLFGTPFTEECDRKREGDREQREKTQCHTVLLLTLLILCCTCIVLDISNSVEYISVCLKMILPAYYKLVKIFIYIIKFHYLIFIKPVQITFFRRQQKYKQKACFQTVSLYDFPVI